MTIENVIRRIQSENNQARTRQSAAFSGLISQTLDPDRVEIDTDAILATLTEKPAADENTETIGG